MALENKDSTITCNDKEEEDDVPLPGFRFHPTDEELVGFYLRRKVEKRPISIELIKQADIYKYDPWDLPKSSNVGGDKEWYFFCKRGRKYRNSVRPNRVTGSGFWKATGIDRPVYSSSVDADHGRDCIGLKKSLVYYRGSAGKGTKTDWMMHEFRLPPSQDKSTRAMDTKPSAQEAEVWTLCRILKRNTSHKKIIPDWRESATKKNIYNPKIDSSPSDLKMQSSYITFTAPIIQQNEQKPYFGHVENTTNQQYHGHFGSPLASQAPSTASSLSSSISGDINELLLRHGDWEDLRSIVDYAATTNPFYL